MSNTKKELGQFFTKRADYILGSLISCLPETATVVDPCAGEWDLLDLIRVNKPKIRIEAYDIDPKDDRTVRRDSLKDMIDYGGKWVVANFPYLARNKAADKSNFLKYGTGDLYKCGLKSIAGYRGNSICEGGIMVIPLNFFCDSDDATREFFLSKYRIVKLNIFEEQVFDDTDYTVCAFSFVREDNDEQKVLTRFFPSGKWKRIQILQSHGYKIGYHFRETIHVVKPPIRVGRLIEDNQIPDGWHKTRLILRAIDTGSIDGRIALKISNEPFHPKDSDKTFARIISSRKLGEQEEEKILREFNTTLEIYRRIYNSLFLTNYRNSTKAYARKRLDFETAYRLIEACTENTVAIALSYSDIAPLDPSETETTNDWRYNPTYNAGPGYIWIKSYSYIRKSGKVVNVRGHWRQKRRVVKIWTLDPDPTMPFESRWKRAA